MSQGFHLFQLQKIDAQLDQGVARALEIKNKIEADTRILDQQRLVDEAEKELATEHSHLKRIEQDTAARRIKLEQSESSLYGGKVRAPKELQDLQNEAAGLKRTISALEDQELEVMIKVEEAQMRLNAVKQQLSAVTAEVATENAALAGESGMLQSLTEKLKIERSVVLNQIDPNFLAEYERLRKAKRGIAVASMVDDACSGCGTVLTPADRQAARSPSSVFHCPSCSRIIYAG